jgi:hypothetical protein
MVPRVIDSTLFLKTHQDKFATETPISWKSTPDLGSAEGRSVEWKDPIRIRLGYVRQVGIALLQQCFEGKAQPTQVCMAP